MVDTGPPGDLLAADIWGEQSWLTCRSQMEDVQPRAVTPCQVDLQTTTTSMGLLAADHRMEAHRNLVTVLLAVACSLAWMVGVYPPRCA